MHTIESEWHPFTILLLIYTIIRKDFPAAHPSRKDIDALALSFVPVAAGAGSVLAATASCHRRAILLPMVAADPLPPKPLQTKSIPHTTHRRHGLQTRRHHIPLISIQ